MLASDVMTRTIVTCNPTDTLVTAAQTMARHHVGALVVLDADGALAGLVTDRDVCLAIAAEDPDRTVEAAMTAVVIWVRPEQTVEQVAHLMAKHQVHRVPVLGPDRVPIGMISLSDLAVGACENGKRRDRVAVARTLAAIRGPRADPATMPHGLRD
jgi:CBS domain-containing protein